MRRYSCYLLVCRRPGDGGDVDSREISESLHFISAPVVTPPLIPQSVVSQANPPEPSGTGRPKVNPENYRWCYRPDDQVCLHVFGDWADQ